jgi:hypothetical protein
MADDTTTYLEELCQELNHTRHVIEEYGSTSEYARGYITALSNVLALAEKARDAELA